MRFKVLLVLITSSIGILGWSQKPEDLLKKRIAASEKKYKEVDKFSTALFYEMYSAYNLEAPEESYDGLFCKSGKNYYFRMHSVEMLNIGNLTVQIQNDARKILIVRGSGKTQENPFDMGKYLDSYKRVSYKVNGNMEQFELDSHEVTQLPFTKVIIYFKNKVEVVKQQFYLAGQANYRGTDGEEKLISPKMTITYSNYKKSVPKGVFLLETYVKKLNKKFIGTGKYQGYEVRYLTGE